MPFDAGFTIAANTASADARAVGRMIDTAATPDADWASANPDRMLAFLFVAPRDCDALDAVLTA